MSWAEYQYLATGHQLRLERQWDYTRHLMAAMHNSSGFAKRRVRPIEIIKLDLLDKPRKIKKIPIEDVMRILRN